MKKKVNNSGTDSSFYKYSSDKYSLINLTALLVVRLILFFRKNYLYLFAVVSFFCLLIYNELMLYQLSQTILIYFNYAAILSLFFHLVIIFIKSKSKQNVLRNSIIDLIAIVISIVSHRYPLVFMFYLIVRQSVCFIKEISGRNLKRPLFMSIYENPAIFVLASFFLTIILGTSLLLMPLSTHADKNTDFIGALFTATSATCVTGLIVYDTGTHFTRFGQTIIMILFQIGGLGIMTISTSFAFFLGQKISLRDQSIMQDVTGESNRYEIIRLIKNIVIVTLLVEAIGAVLLYNVLRESYSTVQEAAFSSVFHSISAFCNAGFSLFSDSFAGFRRNNLLHFVVPLLIVTGGIGFSVLTDIKKNLKIFYNKKFKLRFSHTRLSLHSKIVLTTTIILIVFGTIGFFMSEYHNIMKNFSLADRLLSSFFQSVTTRTAGFNTIDNSELSQSSVFLSLILMFIGASPGSTGGGIKTTSFAVIVLSIISVLKGDDNVTAFKRRISNTTARRVLALIAISVGVLSFVIFCLMMFEPMDFNKIIFEAFSAFGTVGLSMGITPELSNLGKLLITFLMYFGRVGPLTLFFALTTSKPKQFFKFSKERVSIG